MVKNILLNKKTPTVLVFIRYYLPGFKSGGPVRTISNMVDHLGDQINFKIITLDRDYGDKNSFPGLKVNTWLTVGGAKVYYLSPNLRSFLKIIRLLKSNQYDFVYLNSFFDFGFTIFPLLLRWFNLTPNAKWIIAPRGEFSDGALQIKKWKKNPFIYFCKKIGLYKDLLWHLSSKFELLDLCNNMSTDSSKVKIAQNLRIKIAVDLPSLKLTNIHLLRTKSHDLLRIVFLSRISVKKNLDYALRILSKVRSTILFDIYGPIEDPLYWAECKKLINTLPSNISCRYLGPVAHEYVGKVMGEYDLFFFPTLGENYGHVIVEALSQGTPILIADTTPWRSLRNHNVGFDLPLSREDLFIQAIEYYFNLDIKSYLKIRSDVLTYANNSIASDQIVKDNFNLFKL